MKRKLMSIMTALVILIGCADATQTPTSTEKSGITPDHNETSVLGAGIKDSTRDEIQLTPYIKTTRINNEDVTSITVRISESDRSIDVPLERYYTILDGLHWMDELIAKADEQEKPSKPVVIRVKTKTDIYEIPYDLATNRLQIEGDWVYAYDYTLLIMHSLLVPESDIGKIDTLFEEARIEFDKNSSITDTHLINFEQANIYNKDYNSWEKELKNVETRRRIMYYDDATKTVRALSFFTNGIIALNRQLLFTDPKYKTLDGVHVGMPREEALIRLGAPNINLVSHWGYKVGDYIKFHLYFEEDKIKWISLTMPL